DQRHPALDTAHGFALVICTRSLYRWSAAADWARVGGRDGGSVILAPMAALAEATPPPAPLRAALPRRAGSRGARLGVAVALVLLVVAAAALRLARLGNQPGGLFQDEAAEGLDAWRILHVPGFHPLFFADDGGREVTFAYLAAAVFHVTGPSVLALRATAAVLGVLAVAVTPLALRRLGLATVLGGTAWAAGSVWLVA